jgi:hypothetical protein
MDAFEQWMNMTWEKTAKERKEITHKKRESCICPACPTYNRCAREQNELLYCITGKSKLCISEDNWCTCRNCSVTGELGLKYHDFCLKGWEAAQCYENEVR